MANPIDQTVLSQYRGRRAYLAPMAAMSAVRSTWANACLVAQEGDDPRAARFTWAGWKYASEWLMAIEARGSRQSYSGRFWITGKLSDPQSKFTVAVTHQGMTLWSFRCSSPGCAVKHGLAALRVWPGATFTVTDGTGKVWAQDVTALTSLNEVTAQFEARG